MYKISTKSDRTKRYFHQLKLNFIFKILAIIASFFVIPLLIKYLGVERYGIWSTILSIIMWIVYFDLGLGNGLRNKVGESVTNNNYEEARKYISTAYTILSIFAILIFLISIVLSNIIDWNSIFNTELISNETFSKIILTVLFFILLNFVFSLAIQINYALHISESAVMYQFIFNAMVLISIFLLNEFFETNLLYVSVVYGMSIIIASFFVNIKLYKTYQNLRPSLIYFDIKKIKSLFGLGINFFVIQASLLIILSTDKIIITQIFGPGFVTNYDILLKLFTIFLVLHNIIMAPMWSAFTEAFIKKDLKWINNSLQKLILLLIPFSFAIIGTVFFTPEILYLWIGRTVKVSNMLITLMGIFSFIMLWNNIYGNFSNGVSETRLQLISYLLGAFMNIPLSVYFAKYVFHNIEGVILGSIISLSIFSFLGPIHTKKILNKLANENNK